MAVFPFRSPPPPFSFYFWSGVSCSFFSFFYFFLFLWLYPVRRRFDWRRLRWSLRSPPLTRVSLCYEVRRWLLLLPSCPVFSSTFMEFPWSRSSNVIFFFFFPPFLKELFDFFFFFFFSVMFWLFVFWMYVQRIVVLLVWIWALNRG